jgi:hypothetical protein
MVGAQGTHSGLAVDTDFCFENTENAVMKDVFRHSKL